MENKEKSLLGRITGAMDRFTGDKVIFLIALFLMLISVISVFSSTPRLANDTGSDRISIMLKQLELVLAGLLIILSLYGFGKVEWYRKLSQYGFLVSFVCLFIVVADLNLGIVKAGVINGARRIMMVAGKQVHIYEFVKPMMIMYLGWALDTYKNGDFKWAPRLAAKYPRLAFLEKEIWQKIVYIYIPVGTITLMVMMGSNSSAIFIGGIMILMILIGGLDFKDIAIVGGALLVAVGIMFGAYKAGILKDSRLGTAISRIMADDDETMQELLHLKRGSLEWEKARAKLDQPVGALLAIKEGGPLGKGIGNSTQKYQVPVIFGDYMFSFIIEETGLWGAALMILLYYSLL
ncbi:MAG: FtsW/RodA/SpoVE family cell cycle protein, partial [Bacteroidales bacterium]|nr:FtsW/RodA/SpoVE family cell cycle protein [Bacteroidales bacterium]